MKKIRDNWHLFKESEPGSRFQDRYHRRRQDERDHPFRRTFNVVLGAIIAIGSLILSPLPGPGWGTAFIGLGILAGEVLPAARFLDWAEVELQILVRQAKDIWTGSPAVVRVMIVLALLICGASLGYTAYYLFFVH